MRKIRTASLAFTGAAMAVGVGFHAPAAFAASTHTWTVNPGGTTKGTATTTSLEDVTTSAKLTCATASATATFSKTTYTQSGTTSFKAAGLTGTFGTTTDLCTSSLGAKFTAKLSAGNLNAGTYADGVTTGKITDITATITGADGFACHATISGSTTYKYANSGTLTVTGSVNNDHLKVKSATSCAGQLNTGDAAFFAGAYTVNPVETISES